MNRGRYPGAARARPGSALKLLCAASAVAWGLPALPASAQEGPETPSGKNLNISKEFTDDPVVAGRTATLQFSVTNTHLTEDATDVKYTDDLDDMLPGATYVSSEATRALRCVRYDGTDVTGDCDSTSSENARDCGTRLTGHPPGLIRWASGFTVPARSTCYASDVVKIPADAATGSYQSTSGAVTGKYGETSVTGNTARDILRVRADDQPVQVEKWFSGTRNPGTYTSTTRRDSYNMGNDFVGEHPGRLGQHRSRGAAAHLHVDGAGGHHAVRRHRGHAHLRRARGRRRGRLHLHPRCQ